MRSPGATVSPNRAKGTIRRAITPAITRTATRRPGGSSAVNPSSTFSLCRAESARMALRNRPFVYFSQATFPAIGAFCTCTSSTERKMEIRWHWPPMNSGSFPASRASTVPCAAASTNPAPAGTRGVGSRKKKRVKSANTSHTPATAGIISRPAPGTRKPSAPIAASTGSESAISLRPAFLALPECFIRRQPKSAPAARKA